MSGAVELLDPVRGYLGEPRCAVLSTLGSEDAPHQVVVHYLLESDALLINGRADRRWLANLRRDGRASLVIHDAEQPLHWVGIKVAAELWREGEPAVKDAQRLAQRYGEDPAAYRDQQRVTVRLVPQRVYEYG